MGSDAGSGADTVVTNPNDTGSTNDANTASILGTWVAMPANTADAENNNLRLALSGNESGGSFATTITFHGAAGGRLPGCNATITLAGTWTASDTTYSETASTGMVAATGCDDAANSTTTNLDASQIAQYTVNGPYTLSATTLRINSVDYTRQ